MKKGEGSKAASAYEVYHVERPGGMTVCCHPMVANVIARRLFEYNYIIPDGVSLEAEVTHGDSRFDFGGRLKDGRRFFLEVKCVIMADVIDGTDKEVAAAPKDQQKIAIFPYGKRRLSNEPLSPRALKHALGLTECVKRCEAVCYMLYLVMRPDVRAMTVTRLDPTYRKAVIDARATGVNVLALQIGWDGAKASLIQELPVEI
jgi:hypothetical protein